MKKIKKAKKHYFLNISMDSDNLIFKDNLNL